MVQTKMVILNVHFSVPTYMTSDFHDRKRCFFCTWVKPKFTLKWHVLNPFYDNVYIIWNTCNSYWNGHSKCTFHYATFMTCDFHDRKRCFSHLSRSRNHILPYFRKPFYAYVYILWECNAFAPKVITTL